MMRAFVAMPEPDRSSRGDTAVQDVGGHVFITRGDLRRLACDAWLLPGTAGSPPTVSLKWLEGRPDEGAPPLAAHFDGKRLRNARKADGLSRVWRVGEAG